MSDDAPKKLTGNQMPLDVSPALAEIIGTRKGEQVSRPQVLKKLWAYVTEKNLRDPKNKLCFTPDDLMKPIFGSERQNLSDMSKHLKEHLTNPNK